VEFSEFFLLATGVPPYPYQTRLAHAASLPKLLIAPTGAGKTEAAVLAAWLWRRRHAEDEVRRETPRRLVYCLPMRTLVEQTYERVSRWLATTGLSDSIPVTMLMGGQEHQEWYLHPESDQVLIGTQDMLLSRVLNRGYAASPFRWPWEFGLLNNDCLWVVDEVQLMGNGLPTTAQLQAFRNQLGVAVQCQTLWMSATVAPDWLGTVDFPAPTEDSILTLDSTDLESPELLARQEAVKTLSRLDAPRKGPHYDTAAVARSLQQLHKPGGLTLVVVNTVARAQSLYDALARVRPKPELVLVHSRYRPGERRMKNQQVTAPVPEEGAGRIVVATQAIEAGLDISARTLVTELAPWASLVQRFGRCNRRGEYAHAAVYWLDISESEAPPYSAEELQRARERLASLDGRSVAPAHLPSFGDPLHHEAVLRKRDLLGLFDTTADLSGGYLDVSRFVRGGGDSDVSVFWRRWDGDTPPPGLPAPTGDELCTVPVAELRLFLTGKKTGRHAAKVEAEEDDDVESSEDDGQEISAAPSDRANTPGRMAWRWNHAFGQWERVFGKDVYAGMTVLLHAAAGGYVLDRGWDAKARDPVPPEVPPDGERASEFVGDESSNTGLSVWVTLQRHSLSVRDETARLLRALDVACLGDDIQRVLVAAAHLHDLGKAHPVFQETMLSNVSPEERQHRAGMLWAKQGRGSGQTARHRRPHFRHEVASAVAALSLDTGLYGRAIDLLAYLVAAHHGRVRLAMRSLPRSRDQAPDERYLLLGLPITTGGESGHPQDTLPPADLGDGLVTRETQLDLSLARIGASPDGESSWLERTLSLLNWLGPFRLAYLEALLRAADVRSSKAEQQGGGQSHD